MDYVKTLRSLVGNFPLELPGTGIIVYKREGASTFYLLQNRLDGNGVGLLGGGIELYETYRECAVRELYEESGILAEAEYFDLLDVYAGTRHITVYPSGDVVHHTVVVFSIDYDVCSHQEEVMSTNETKSLEWFDASEISYLLQEGLIFPNNAPILEDLINGKFQF